MIASGIKRGTAELAVLSILQSGALHGYEIAHRIEQETKGSLRFTLAALYPLCIGSKNKNGFAEPGKLAPSAAAAVAIASPQRANRSSLPCARNGPNCSSLCIAWRESPMPD